jgi:hypothetical protein
MTEDLKPIFTRQFSFGNAVQIGVLLVSLAVVYATLDARSKANTEATLANRQAIAAQELRMRALEQNFARTDERLSSILTLVTRIDAKLERLENGK